MPCVVGLCLIGMIGVPAAFGKSKGHDQLELGTQLYQEERYAEAKTVLEEATRLDPGLFTAWENLGWVYQRLGESERALEVWENVLMIEPNQTRILNASASVYSDEGQRDRAVEYFERSVKADPTQDGIRLRLARILTELGRYDRAEVHLREALRDHPNNAKVLVRLAKNYEAAGNLRPGIEMLRTFLSLRPHRHVLSLGTFRTLSEAEGRQQMMRSRYRDIMNSDSLMIRMERVGLSASQVYRLVFESVQDEDHGQTVCRRLQAQGHWCVVVQQLLPSAAEAPSLETDEMIRVQQVLANLYAYQGDLAFRNKQFSEAEQAYRDSLLWRPYHVTTLNNLGFSLENQEQFEKAIQAWRESLIENRRQGLLFQHVANAWYQAGDFEQARMWYERVAAADATNQEVEYRLFEFAMDAGDQPTANRWLQQLFADSEADRDWSPRIGNSFIRHDAIGPGIEFFLARLQVSREVDVTKKEVARLYTKQALAQRMADHMDLAMVGYQQALVYDEWNQIALRDLGWVWWTQNRWKDCEAIWTRYQRQFPSLLEPYNLLTHFYLHQEHYEKAIHMAKKSLALDPFQPSQQLKLIKGLYWAKRFPEARALMAQLVLDYPDDSAIQYFYGEMLMQQLDFSGGVSQWRHVLDLGVDVPRAHYYWMKSLYETGHYADAVTKAKQYVSVNPPYKHIMKLIIDDALFRDDKAEAIVWYERVVESLDAEAGDWLELVSLYQATKQLEKASLVLEEAVKQCPTDVEVWLASADFHLHTGKIPEAIEEFQMVQQLTPDNRRAFVGLLNAYKGQEAVPEALQYLEHQNQNFLKEYEEDLERGALYASVKEFDDAKIMFARVTKPLRAGAYVPILLYHGLSPHARSKNLWVNNFANQLRALKDAGYTAITVQDLSAMRQGVRPFPEKPIMLTFDDARRDAFVLGDPLLQQYGMRATMFVPTARIHSGHPFFADWDEIRRYANNGRWDIQAHGHLAHDLIPINASGTTGTFLTNFQWLTETQRLETPEEFERRLRGDYQTNLAVMKQFLPDPHVLGYAFPFSEAGQSSNGTATDARALNERLLNRFFEFGFIQDLDGYNWIATGEMGTALLRRVTVGREWDGQMLVQHLSEKHPSNQAQVSFAKIQYWNGYYAEAEEAFKGIQSKEPRLEDPLKYYLADISFQGGRYWESRQFLNSISQQDTPLHEQVEALREKVDWKNRPRIFSDFTFFKDSNHRTNHSEFATAFFPLSVPVEIGMTGGAIHFAEKSRKSFSGSEVKGMVNWRANSWLYLEGAIRRRSITEKHNTHSYWAGGQLGRFDTRVLFNWTYRDVDTARAIGQGIQAHSFNLGFETRQVRPVFLRVSTAYQDYDDGNTGFDLRSNLQYALPFLTGWQLGTDLAYHTSKFEGTNYYAPTRLIYGLGRVLYQGQPMERLFVEGNVGIGGANSQRDGTRWITNGDIRVDYNLTAQFRAGAVTSYSLVPGYKSVTVQATLGYRF